MRRRLLAWSLVALLVGMFLAMAWLMPTPAVDAPMTRSWLSGGQGMQPVFVWASWLSAAGVIAVAALLDDDLWSD